jgi:hypothetical protein
MRIVRAMVAVTAFISLSAVQPTTGQTPDGPLSPSDALKRYDRCALATLGGKPGSDFNYCTNCKDTQDSRHSTG